MTRNNSTWAWLLTSLGVFAVVVGLVGGVRAQDDLQPGWCKSEIRPSRGGDRAPNTTVYFSAVFEGVNPERGAPPYEKWDREFVSAIRMRFPDAALPEYLGRGANAGWRCTLTFLSIDYAIRSIEEAVQEYEADNRKVHFMDWVPPNTRLLRTLRHEDDESEGEGKIFGPKAEKALNAWRDKHGIEDRGAFANTLMLMVQTALILQAFDPGPADGVIGKRTLAAIVAWQTMQGFPEGSRTRGADRRHPSRRARARRLRPRSRRGDVRAFGDRGRPGMGAVLRKGGTQPRITRPERPALTADELAEPFRMPRTASRLFVPVEPATVDSSGTPATSRSTCIGATQTSPATTTIARLVGQGLATWTELATERLVGAQVQTTMRARRGSEPARRHRNPCGGARFGILRVVTAR